MNRSTDNLLRKLMLYQHDLAEVDRAIAKLQQRLEAAATRPSRKKTGKKR